MSETKTLTMEVLVNRSQAELFSMLTQPEDLSAWFCEHAAVDLERGHYSFWGRFTPGTPAADSDAVRLLACSAPDSLQFGWTVRGAETVVLFSLEARGVMTQLTVEHAGIPARSDEHEMAFHDFWYVALENLRLYATSGEQQQLCSYAPKQGPSIELAVTVNGGADAVFDKIAKPEQIDRYYGSNSTVELEVGGKFDFGWKDSLGPIKILELDAPHKLSFSWKFDEPFETVVTWQLEESGGRTRLTLTHSGFAEDYDSEGYRAGWFSFLAIIKGMVELGEDWSMIEIKGGAHGDV